MYHSTGMTNSALKSDSIDSAPATILIIDDESSIRRTLEGIFKDEGYQVVLAEDGERALALIAEQVPSLAFLDIWMPGMDGMETLKRIRQLAPGLPVIMMSGHATIATAIAATRMGAEDFVEKPLDLHQIINRVRQAIGQGGEATDLDGEEEGESGAHGLSLAKSRETTGINPIVFREMGLPGRVFTQKTLAQSAVLYGQGLHSGKKSGLMLEPLPPFSGIHFLGMSEGVPVPAHVDFVESTGFATTVRLGPTQAGTIEHIMSALHAYGISNLLIKCNGEVPVMDGSAREFCSLFDEVGIEDQKEEWPEIVVNETLQVGNEKEYIRLEPGDDFTIDYTLRYPAPIGEQRMTFTLSNPETYLREIAPARTFGFVRDVGMLQQQGLALGGRFDNFVLIGEEGVINTALRFPDEAVRHKILDAIGDLFLLGRRIRGRVTACMTGHSDNIALLKLLSQSIRKSLGHSK